MFFLCFLLSLGLLAHAQSSILLGYIPLIVKTPYLHCWVRSNSQTAPEQVWPTLFAPTHVSHTPYKLYTKYIVI
jgi:hypothetical protein